MAPEWFKTAIQGPAYGQHLRRPGCNGGVCYCNDRDFCNDKNNSQIRFFPSYLLLTILAITFQIMK